MNVYSCMKPEICKQTEYILVGCDCHKLVLINYLFIAIFLLTYLQMALWLCLEKYNIQYPQKLTVLLLVLNLSPQPAHLLNHTELPTGCCTTEVLGPRYHFNIPKPSNSVGCCGNSIFL